MIAQRVRGIHNLLVGCQAMLGAGLFWGWFQVFVWFYPQDPGVFVAEYARYCALLVLGIGLEAVTRSGEYIATPLYQKNILKQIPVAFRQVAFALGTLLSFVVLSKDQTISRVFLVSFSPLLYTMLLATNYALPKKLAFHVFKGDHTERTLLVGPVERAVKMAPWLHRKEQFGVNVVGILSLDPVSVPWIPRFGAPAEIGRILNEASITQVILLEIPEDAALSRRVIEATEYFGARLLILSNLEEKLRHPIVNFDDDGLKFIAFHHEPLENPFNRICKRMADLVISTVVILLVLLPVAVVVWLIQRLQSPGPLFFVQTRAGIQNKRFNIIKFRTMDVPGASVAEENHDPGRVYPLARFLRRYSIDEIPQFFNVFRGEMSVIGPRPHLLVHNDQFALVMKNYHIRSLIKPGITGLAQVRGFRGEAKDIVDIDARLQSDIEYIENWSMALDITIFFRTIYQMIRPPAGAR